MDEPNKPLNQLSPDFIRNDLKAITFDVDGVIIPTGTLLRESLDGSELTMKTHKLSSEMISMIKELKKHFWINISSGRSLLFLEYMLEDILWDKISLIGENGNFILMDGKIEQLATYGQTYFQKITNIQKDLRKLRQEMPDKIYGLEPKHIIISLHAVSPMPEIEAIVQKNDPEHELYCLWTGEAYDIGHSKTNKLTAARLLVDRLKIDQKQMLTTGNNLNDKEMLSFGTGVSVDPERVSGDYAIPKIEGQLGGEVLARYLLDIVSH